MQEILTQSSTGIVVFVSVVVFVLTCTGIGTLLLPKIKNNSPSAYFVRFIVGALAAIGFGLLGYILGGLF